MRRTSQSKTGSIPEVLLCKTRAHRAAGMSLSCPDLIRASINLRNKLLEDDGSPGQVFSPVMTISNPLGSDRLRLSMSYTGKKPRISGMKKMARLMANPMFHRIDRSLGRLPR